MLSLAIFVASMVVLQADTVVVIGMTQRDLTGDGQPEILRLVGVGPSVDSLDVTLSIESAGRTVYRAQLAPITRTVGFDRSRRKLSRAQHRERPHRIRQMVLRRREIQATTGVCEELA